MRSNFRTSRSECFCGEWLDAAGFNWTPDMVTPVDRDEIEEFDPPRELDWPDAADSMIIHHSIRHYRPRIWRNAELDLYSRPNESREEFSQRCHEREVRERVLQREELRDTFLRRVIELKAVMMKMVAEESVLDTQRDRRLATVRGLFSDLVQEWDRMPLQDDDPAVRPGTDADGTDRDLHEMVESIRADLRYRFGRIQVELRPHADTRRALRRSGKPLAGRDHIARIPLVLVISALCAARGLTAHVCGAGGRWWPPDFVPGHGSEPKLRSDWQPWSGSFWP